MALTLLLTTLTTALIVNTWLDRNGLFVPILRRLQMRVGPGIWGTLAAGALCRYCVTHWVGAVVSLALAPEWWSRLVLIAPTIWLANHSISLYSLLSEQLTAVRTHTQVEQAQLQMMQMTAQRQGEQRPAA